MQRHSTIKPHTIRTVVFCLVVCVIVIFTLVYRVYIQNHSQKSQRNIDSLGDTSNITIDALSSTARNISKEYVLEIKHVPFDVIFADDPYKRQIGLSGMVRLGYTTAMLFSFDKEGYQGFWMKDMNFPIDIIWLDSHFRVVHIEQGVSPNTYPKTFIPNTLSLYVVEVPSGTSKRLHLEIGDEVHVRNR